VIPDWREDPPPRPVNMTHDLQSDQRYRQKSQVPNYTNATLELRSRFATSGTVCGNNQPRLSSRSRRRIVGVID
jgi:hypothetical protein